MGASLRLAVLQVCFTLTICDQPYHRFKRGYSDLPEGKAWEGLRKIHNRAYASRVYRDIAYTCPNLCFENETRGRCVGGSCTCKDPFSGIDCALSNATGDVSLLAGHFDHQDLPSPRIYVYELPSILTTVPQSDRPAELAIYERLVSGGHRELDPARADYFYVPLNLRYLTELGVSLAMEYIITTWPFFNRTGGADHLIMHTSDWGACNMQTPLNHAQCTARRCFVPERYSGMIHLTHWGLARADPRYFAEGPCHTPGKDIVLPSVETIKYNPRASPHYRLADAVEGPPAPRDITLFFAGAGMAAAAPPPNTTADPPRRALPRPLVRPKKHQAEHSGGVRQKVYEQHREEPGFELVAQSSDYAAKMAGSVFCLAPAGAGHGIRAQLALQYGCIPVVIQDAVEQAFEEVLPWQQFAVRVPEADIPRLPEILRAISPAEVERMQRAGACVFPRMLWSSVWGSWAGEDGSADAFDTLLHVLRRRLTARKGGGAPAMDDVCAPLEPPSVRLRRPLLHQPDPALKTGLCVYRGSCLTYINGTNHPFPPGGAIVYTVPS